MPMSNVIDTATDAIGYRGSFRGHDYDYVYGDSPYVRSTATDAGYNSWMAAGA